MFLRILKKDLRRKRTTNLILLLFIIMAATFLSSSVNNILTVSTALNRYLEKAEVPDYWILLSNADDDALKRFDALAAKNDYEYKTATLLQIDFKDIQVNQKPLEYNQTVCISTLGGIRIFDETDDELLTINDGELYVTAYLWNSYPEQFYPGAELILTLGGEPRAFTVKGCAKDALFGAATVGMTRFFISENDFRSLRSKASNLLPSLLVNTDDPEFQSKMMDCELNNLFFFDRATVKQMYFMDTMTAAVMLVASLCLIFISMVILRFTIQFTMQEEFREIGVMKAIGIPISAIRRLYIVKYLTISALGSCVGLALSFPFTSLLMRNVSRNMVLPKEKLWLLNVCAAVLTAALVICFCYFCTRRMKRFSPLDAIRSGETGERYSHKSPIRLNRSRLPLIPFLSLNDIFSGAKRYVSMLVIFTLGILLILLPVNTINTLRSDRLVTLFGMAPCDAVISQEMLLSPSQDNRALMEEKQAELRNRLSEQNIDARVFQEVMFRMFISHGDKKTSSLALQGLGEVSAEEYVYIEGSAPQSSGEVALSHIVADRIGAGVGDDVRINLGSETKTFTVTALYQSMNNLGEGIRFHPDEPLDYAYAGGNFGLQIAYADAPDKAECSRRLELLARLYPEDDVYTAGGYIDHMSGDIAGQLEGVKNLLLGIVLCVNMLVATLIIKSFLTKETTEIALLKALGFRNRSLMFWQALRIGIVLLLSVLAGILLSTPLSKLLIQPIFRMMGAYSITFTVRPLEVYVGYPLLLLTATFFAAVCSAGSLRKIPASKCSGME